MAVDKNLSPVGQTAILMIRTYQKLLSPLLGQHCRFYPSCSQYTLEAIQEWGLAKGMWLGAKRISRCHPLNEGGIDPIPRRNASLEQAQNQGAPLQEHSLEIEPTLDDSYQEPDTKSNDSLDTPDIVQLAQSAQFVQSNSTVQAANSVQFAQPESAHSSQPAQSTMSVQSTQIDQFDDITQQTLSGRAHVESSLGSSQTKSAPPTTPKS